MGADVDAAGRLYRGLGTAVWSAASGRAAPSAGCRRRENSIGCSALGVRIPSWRIKRSAISFCSRRGIGRSQPRLRLQGENDIFPHRGSGDNAVGFCDPPDRSRSRGRTPDAGSARSEVCLLIHAFPLSAVLMPKITSAVSVRPEPSRPARPTISPGRTCRSNGAMVPFTVAFKRRYRFIAQQGTARPLQGIVVQFATQHHFHQPNLRQLAGSHGSPQMCRYATR